MVVMELKIKRVGGKREGESVVRKLMVESEETEEMRTRVHKIHLCHGWKEKLVEKAKENIKWRKI